MNVALVTLVALVAVVFAAAAYGASRWRASTRDLRERLEGARSPITPVSYDPRELDGVPAPVQRYFHAVLRDGQPLVASARISHEGRFNMGEAREKWVSFTSDQLVVTRRPGFDWNARIRMAPGLNVFVQDAYAEGEGTLRASLLGLMTVANQPDTPELAQGELMRFFAESVWYPTALLPSQGVRWEPIDETSARASLTDGSIAVSLEFHFDASGLIGAVRSSGRYRLVRGEHVVTPWQGRFWSYELRDGMRVPMDGEVAWLLPEGPRPYWRGHMTKITYDFVE